jgi:mannose-6-phosphate isomerase-like protein (cupin superfamily)
MKMLKEHEVKGDELPPPYARVLKHLAEPWTLGTKRISFVLSKVKVGGRSNPHSHGVSEEVFYVISGRGKITVDGEEAEIEPGSCIYIPVGEVHQLINTGDETLNVASAASPPWKHQKFQRVHKIK